MKSLTFKRILATSTASAIYFGSTAIAFAQTSMNPCADTTNPFNASLCTIDSSQTGTFVSNLIVAAFVIAGLIALFFLIWGGIKWILSGGDKGKVETARSTIIAALIGLIVTFLAYFLLSLTLSLFGLGLEDLTIPQLNVP